MNEPEMNYYPISIAVVPPKTDTGVASIRNIKPNTSPVVVEETNIMPTAGGTVMTSRIMRSPNYSYKKSGWKFDSAGNIEANNGIFRGDFEIGGAVKTIDDVTKLQTSLDEISADGGGTVYLKAGTYTLTDSIFVPSGCTLEGVSKYGVILDCDNQEYTVTITGDDAYNTGTITINNGDTSVIGDSTVWTSAMVGRSIFLDGLWYEILTRVSNTEITISAYQGVNLAGSTYMIATPNLNARIKNLTVINAVNAGILINYADEPLVDNVVVYDCGEGINIEYATYPQILNSSCSSNGKNLYLKNVEGFYINYSEFSYSTTTQGAYLEKANNATIFNTSFDDNTDDGINLVDCDKIASLSLSVSGNGGQGVELTSDCNDNTFEGSVFDSNTSDGVKLTATSDRNTIVACSLTNNGGYGINIAASTCDNNQLVAIAYNNNTSGNLNNAGTTTTQLYSVIASTDLRDSADTETSGTSTTYVKVKEIQYKEIDGTITTKFDLRLDGASNKAYGRIYKNGVAYGTEQEQGLNSTYTTFSENLSFKTGDLIQLYVHKTVGGSDYSYRNFRLYYNKILVVNTGTINLD